ncbi:MAG: prephenate dehydrogenase [Candidatus Tyrphobacter sp.]
MSRLGILGTGLIGASIGMRARRDGVYVLGCDAQEQIANEARELGALDECASRDDLYARCSTIVIAAPLEASCAELTALRGRKTSWDLLLDVASVKGPVAQAARGVGSFVGTHPLAGSQGSGPASATGDLFEERSWAYVPTGNRALDERASDFIRRMGAQPFACDAERHDRIVAATSHLPQLLAWLLAKRMREVDDQYERYCGPAAREVLRLSQSPASLWDEIMRANALPVQAEASALTRALASACERLVSDEKRADEGVRARTQARPRE